MRGQVAVRLPAMRGGGRRRTVGADVAPDPPDADPIPAPERIPRVARVLALAHHWQGLIRSGAVGNQANLARLVGVSRARVTQVMNLLWLAPDIQETLLLGRQPPPGGEWEVRRCAAEPVWQGQRRRWSERGRGRVPA